MKESLFQFSKPLLEDVVFKVNDGEIQGEKIEIKHEVFVKVDENSDNSKETLVHVKVRIGGPSKTDDSIDVDAYPFFIEISMQSNFIFEKIEDEALKNELLRKNAPVLLVSYIRTIVHIITSMSKFPAFDIPFLDFSEPSENRETK